MIPLRKWNIAGPGGMVLIASSSLTYQSDWARIIKNSEVCESIVSGY